jgi:YidC/Oxa1 family membrane protein insertase
MSIWICFIMPASMGIYWIANSVFGMIRDWALTSYYTKKFLVDDKEWLEREARREAEEAEYERKRIESERRKAAGLIEDNKNTSKKKKQAQEKQMREEMKAAAIAAERAERRERLGVQEAEVPASQVGNRRYARGRAYDPDRFKVEE